ncbi:Probable non-specific lipid-transfer protein AKCS9 [Linum perenne]
MAMISKLPVLLLLYLFFAAAITIAASDGSVDCSPMELISCLPAITSGSAPSDQCCGKLKEQEPCFCTYINNPDFGQYVTSPNAKKVLATCAVPYPSC